LDSADADAVGVSTLGSTMSDANCYAINPDEAVTLVDENTVLVCAILGSSYTGEYDDVAAINRLLLEKNKQMELSVWDPRRRSKWWRCFPFHMPGSPVGFPTLARDFDQCIKP
jgi:hypothetical protein